MQNLLNNFKSHKRVYFVAAVLLLLVLLTQIKFINQEPAPDSVFSPYAFSAEAVFVVDDKTGEVIYEENADSQIEIASVTKIMTALVAMEEMEGETITIDEQSFYSVGDTGLLRDEKWRTEDLVSFMMVNSSNDAAEALARGYDRGFDKFVEKMNDRARELELDLIFNNPTGLNETEDFGGKGSARDVARLLSYTYKAYPAVFSGTRDGYHYVASQDAVHVAENTNLAANAFLGLQAGKTGFTDKAGGSLAVRFNAGLHSPVIAVVLGTETREERFSDMIEVIKATTQSIVDRE